MSFQELRQKEAEGLFSELCWVQWEPGLGTERRMTREEKRG